MQEKLEALRAEALAQLQAAEDLKAIGINAYSYVSPETAHEWQTWRRSLYQFAQLIFK